MQKRQDGEMQDGEMQDGEMQDGVMQDGVMQDGVMQDGEMQSNQDGEMHNMQNIEMQNMQEGEMQGLLQKDVLTVNGDEQLFSEVNTSDVDEQIPTHVSVVKVNIGDPARDDPYLDRAFTDADPVEATKASDVLKNTESRTVQNVFKDNKQINIIIKTVKMIKRGIG